MGILVRKRVEEGLGNTLSLFNGAFYAFWDKNCFWFRFFKKAGLHGIHKNAKSYIPFGERMGYTKSLKLFGWTIKVLK